jgi:FkbM family methyltransferase
MRIITPHELLPLIKPYLCPHPTIVEAGSFHGRDTRLLSTYWPQGAIHAFEPVPTIFEQLKKNTKDLSNVYHYQQALSSRCGSALFHVAEYPAKPEKACPAGSLLTPKERLRFSPIRYPKTIEVGTTTLDAWADEHRINQIDFLWLDLQGHELSVMQAAPHMLQNVRAIFTEVEFVHAYEQQPLHTQVCAWLASQGFVPIAQDFRDTTTWFFGNILFVKYSLLG